MSATRTYPILDTDRLQLRQFELSDARETRELAGPQEMAKTTFLPHPYKDGEAERWIMSQYEDFKHNRMVNFAIELKETGALIGSIGLQLELLHQRAQLGFWVGMPYWNKGYCTEAAREVITFGFDKLRLNRIYAIHFGTNPASGRVLKKIGMSHEGTQKQHFIRFGQVEDAEMYGMMKSCYRATTPSE